MNNKTLQLQWYGSRLNRALDRDLLLYNRTRSLSDVMSKRRRVSMIGVLLLLVIAESEMMREKDIVLPRRSQQRDILVVVVQHTIHESMNTADIGFSRGTLMPQKIKVFIVDWIRTCLVTDIPTWGSSIGPECFLPSILLLVVIIVVVVIVVVTVVVVEGFEAVTFPSIFLGNPPMKASMSFSVFGTMFGHKTANSWNLLIPSDLIGLFYSNRLGVRIPLGKGIISQGVLVGLVFLLGLLALAIVTACASRAAATLSATIDLTSDEDPTDEDGYIGMGDSTGVLVSLGGGIYSGGKKSQESNIGDSGNTGDGGKTGGGSIGACGGIGGSLAVALYACIYGSS
ncbi:hypothetical protein Tco_0278188 [Tanacetum coccineum]